jgi:hypothetical protein
VRQRHLEPRRARGTLTVPSSAYRACLERPAIEVATVAFVWIAARSSWRHDAPVGPLNVPVG